MVLHWKQSFDGSGIVCLGNSAGDSEPYKCEYVLTNQTGRGTDIRVALSMMPPLTYFSTKRFPDLISTILIDTSVFAKVYA
jgi:hypothetical protein